MENEFIDLLDINGNKTGVIKNRKDASMNNDIYKVVYLWIVNDGKCLIQQRSFSKKNNPGLWDCAVAGHVLSGESSIEAIIREAKEELNIKFDDKKLELIFSNVGYEKNRFQFHDVYLLNDNIDINKIKIQKDEVECCKYVDLDELQFIINEEKFAKDFHNSLIYKEIFNKLNIK